MSQKVIIKIDDDAEHLTLENGLSIAELGELCVAISGAIGDKEGRLVLKKIREASAVYEFMASTEQTASQFQVVWSRLESSDESDLSEKEQKLLKVVNKVMKPSWHIEAQDADGKRIARLDNTTSFVKKAGYWTTRTIYGQLFTFGATIGKNENGIVIKDDFGQKHSMVADKELFDSLRNDFNLAYRTVKIAFKVRGMVNTDGKFYNLQLVHYRIPTESFLDSIQSFLTKSQDQFSHIDDPEAEIKRLRNHG
ncbi:MAG: hypothetical protein KA239_05390 [Bacteroidia bacterium]|nr:hypothetical protein [Bacteroidia bacterium]